MAPPNRSPWRAAVAMVTNPPMLWPMTTGGPAMPPASATATTSSVHCSREYSVRVPLSPCPDRSTDTTRNSPLNSEATWVHQWAWAPPPWTNTRPRVPGVPQARAWMAHPSTVTSRSVRATPRARRNQGGASGVGRYSCIV